MKKNDDTMIPHPSNRVTFTELCVRGCRRCNTYSKADWLAYTMCTLLGINPRSSLRSEIQELLEKHGKTLGGLRKKFGTTELEFADYYKEPKEEQLFNQGLRRLGSID